MVVVLVCCHLFVLEWTYMGDVFGAFSIPPMNPYAVLDHPTLKGLNREEELMFKKIDHIETEIREEKERIKWIDGEISELEAMRFRSNGHEYELVVRRHEASSAQWRLMRKEEELETTKGYMTKKARDYDIQKEHLSRFSQLDISLLGECTFGRGVFLPAYAAFRTDTPFFAVQDYCSPTAYRIHPATIPPGGPLTGDTVFLGVLGNGYTVSEDNRKINDYPGMGTFPLHVAVFPGIIPDSIQKKIDEYSPMFSDGIFIITRAVWLPCPRAVDPKYAIHCSQQALLIGLHGSVWWEHAGIPYILQEFVTQGV